jgi:hypothetical protein
MDKKARLTLLLSLIAYVSAAHAKPILYSMTLQGSGQIVSDTYATDQSGTHLVKTTTENVVGGTYHGLFAIDSSILAADGTQEQGPPLIFFTLQIADDRWSYDLPNNNAFAGFRGPGDFSYEPGFNIVNGHLIGMCGGVFGGGDVPFVDFAQCDNGSYANIFSAVGDDVIVPNGTFSFPDLIQGTFEIQEVPEPGTLLLAITGFAFFGFGWLRRRV